MLTAQSIAKVIDAAKRVVRDVALCEQKIGCEVMNVDPFENIAIVPLRSEHIDSLRDAVDIVARERKYLEIVEADPPEKFREEILKHLSDGDPFIVAIAAGNVVGWCEAFRWKVPSFAHRWIMNASVRPEFRGCGLGRRLVTSVLNQAREVGVIRVELSAFANNTRAIALYEKLGFKKEANYRSVVQIDGKLYDGVGMG